MYSSYSACWVRARPLQNPTEHTRNWPAMRCASSLFDWTRRDEGSVMRQESFLHLVKSQWIWSANVPVFGQGRDSGGDNQMQSVSEQEKVYQEFVNHYHLSSQGFFGDED